MKRIRRRDGSVVTVADNYVMQDGETIVVGAMFMDGLDGLDGVQRAVALGGARLHDGRGQPVGFKPGFIFTTPVRGADRSCELLMPPQLRTSSAAGRWTTVVMARRCRSVWWTASTIAPAPPRCRMPRRKPTPSAARGWQTHGGKGLMPNTALEDRLAAAFDDGSKADDVKVLIKEVEAAALAADEAVKQARERALDPASKNVALARREMSDADFRRDRLQAALPKLQARHEAAR